ncbi:MAG: hypothetical protein ACKPKO_13615 [Candidatus Fonsibacter sp.]
MKAAHTIGWIFKFIKKEEPKPLAIGHRGGGFLLVYSLENLRKDFLKSLDEYQAQKSPKPFSWSRINITRKINQSPNTKEFICWCNFPMIFPHII